MKMFLSYFVVLVGLFTTTAFTPSTSAVGKWVKLGSKKVNYGLDRDVIHVGLRDGSFSKLKVQVKGGAVNMHRIVVEYRNGSKEEIQVRHNFRRNAGSRIIDLNGGKRMIKDVTFWYDTKNVSRRKATVHLLGRR